MKCCLATFFGIVGLLACQTNLSTSEVVIPQETSVDKIIVRLPGKSSVKDDDLLKVITDKAQISKTILFVERQLHSQPGWYSESDVGNLLPQPFLNLAFYLNDTYLFSFGMGNEFFSSLNKDGYRIRHLSPNEKKEFLNLIEITEEEYEKLYQDWTKPGPWKKKP